MEIRGLRRDADSGLCEPSLVDTEFVTLLDPVPTRLRGWGSSLDGPALEYAVEQWRDTFIVPRRIARKNGLPLPEASGA